MYKKDKHGTTSNKTEMYQIYLKQILNNVGHRSLICGIGHLNDLHKHWVRTNKIDHKLTSCLRVMASKLSCAFWLTALACLLYWESTSAEVAAHFSFPSSMCSRMPPIRTYCSSNDCLLSELF